jgi:hypothetical protein
MLPVVIRIAKTVFAFRRNYSVLAAAGFLLVYEDVFAAFPIAPAINTNNILNVTNFGAIGDGVTTNTTAIQNAINQASGGGTTNGLIGGVVEIPASAGAYLCGPLTLQSKVNIKVDSGATLKMLPVTAWPNPSTTFMNGSSIHDVMISGLGTIDGNAHFGSSDWWGPLGGSPMSTRPNFIAFTGSSNILIQDVTLQNPPTFHIMLKNNNANVTVSNIVINTSGSSPNTDGFDIASTNVLIENSSISDGDDDVEIGGSGGRAADILVTNCVFGTGHGVSFGSITSGGVSNVIVINCSFTGTDYGIRLKSDNSSSGGGSGGLCQNFSFLNLAMTNINKGPIVIYSYYSEVGTPTNISPLTAATEPVDPVTSTTVVWRNITFSNLTLNTPGTLAGIIWGRIEMPVTNVVFSHVNFTTLRAFDIYNAAGVQFADCQMNLPASITNFLLYNAQVVITNSAPTNRLFRFDGLTTNGYANTFTLYNAAGWLKNTNTFAFGPLTLAASSFTVSNNLTLFSPTVLNFTLGTNAATVSVISNLALGGTINITNGPGFTNGTYTLLTCGKTISGNLPALSGKPPGFSYVYTLTNASGQINLLVQSPPPPVINGITLLDGTKAIISGTGGNTNFNVYVLASTNIGLPLNNWTRIATNQFLANGNFNFTNTIPPDAPQTFYLLQYP